MREEIKSIDIIPAIFLKKREDGNILLKCKQDDDFVNRAFEPKMFKGFENSEYLLISIMTGENLMKIKIFDGTEFKELYHQKWNFK